MEEWESLEPLDFPGYEVSSHGRVRSVKSGRILKQSTNQEGIVRVGLMKAETGKQVTATVVRLVAQSFVRGRSAQFATPIHLDNDRTNCRAENLMWRPRWFAVLYFQQFKKHDTPAYNGEIYDVETSDRYANSREAAMKHGLLEEAITKSVVNGSPCFPTWYIFARV